MARRYDSSTTTFSPEGRLHQVEYAIEAINNAGTSVGILASDGVVMASEKKITSGLLAPARVSIIIRESVVSQVLVLCISSLAFCLSSSMPLTDSKIMSLSCYTTLLPMFPFEPTIQKQSQSMITPFFLYRLSPE